MRIDHKSVQRALKAAGVYRGQIDGDFGPASKAAAREFARRRAPRYETRWNDARVRTAAEQAMLKDLGFYSSAIDGIEGPATQAAIEKWQDHITFVRPSPNPSAGVPLANLWPRQRDMREFYGEPGTGHVRITPPYPIFYGGQPMPKGYFIHQRCHDSRMRIYERTLAEYGLERIAELGIDRFGGCYNNRVMRNGTALSTHAFACAEDWDPARNPLRADRTTAQFAKPAYGAFIDAFEREGWISLGRARNFDWMHFQAARL